MKRRELSIRLPAAFILAALPLLASGSYGALMTYQGRLQESGSPVTGNRDVNIALCDDPSVGNCFLSGLQGVAVSNGLFRTTFTVPAAVDLNSGAWFLEVRIGPVLGPLNTLSPRERLTDVPYAAALSPGTVVVKSTSAIAGHTVLDVRNDAAASLFRVRQDGNVGIGTSAPLRQLHVGGAAAAEFLLENTGQSADAKMFRFINRSQRLEIGTTNDAVTLDQTMVASFHRDGRVGIGTTNPVGLFQVAAGTLTVLSSGRVGIGTTSPKGAVGALQLGTRLNIFSDAASNISHICWNCYESAPDGTLKYIGAGLASSIANNSANGEVTIYTFPSGAADQTLSGGVANVALTAVGGKVGIGVMPLSKLDVNGGAAIGAYAGVSAGPSNGLIVSGNVGIGTTSPARMLDVVGTAGARFLSGTSSAGTTINIGRTAEDGSLSIAGAPGQFMTGSATGDLILASFVSTGKIHLATGNGASETPRLTVDPTAGNVGIGTTNPGAVLDVVVDLAGVKVRNANASVNASAPVIRFLGGPGGATEVGFIGKGDQGSGNLHYRNGLVGGAVILGTFNFSNALYVSDTGGNVGIGDTAPGSRLTVTGGDGYVKTQGTGVILRATDGTNCYRLTVNNTGTLSTLSVTCP